MALDFHIVVIIFISCMIALALLIYYCQERRNPKYDIKDYQKSVSAIAMSIAAPGLAMQEPRGSTSSPPIILRYPPPKAQPPPGYICDPRRMHEEDEMSDSGSSSSSSRIYFNANSTAYSVAKRMSETPKYKPNFNKRSSETPYPELSYTVTDEIPRRNLSLFQKREAFRNSYRPSSAIPRFLDKRMSLDPIFLSNIEQHSPTEKIVSVPTGTHSFTVKKIATPTLLEPDETEMNIPKGGERTSRSVSPFIPATVAAFTNRSKSRSKSPMYVSTCSESPYRVLKDDNESPFMVKKSTDSGSKAKLVEPSPGRSDSPSPPKLESAAKHPERLNLAFSVDYNASNSVPLTPVEEE